MRGICVHQPTKDDLKEIADSNYTHIRQALFWNQTNPKKGRYEFGLFDEIAETCERLKLGILWEVCYGNDKLYPAPDDKIPPSPVDGQWLQWLQIVKARYSRYVWGFEIHNEPNRAEFWKPSPDAKAYFHVSAMAAAHLWDSKTKPLILVGALSNKNGSDELDWPFIEELIRLGIMRVAGGFSIHPYTRKPVETRQKDVNRLNALLNGPNDVPSKIVFSEMGSSLAWGLTPQEQRAKNDEAFAFCDRNEIPMFEYCWHNRNAKGKVEQGYSVKPLAVGSA